MKKKKARRAPARDEKKKILKGEKKFRKPGIARSAPTDSLFLWGGGTSAGWFVVQNGIDKIPQGGIVRSGGSGTLNTAPQHQKPHSCWGGRN